jgi:hypothetical protein
MLRRLAPHHTPRRLNGDLPTQWMSVQGAERSADHRDRSLLELTEVARLDELAASWTVVVGDDVLVLLTHDADWDRLTLAAEVATPPADRQARIHATLLQYNNQWAATGGIRMALAEPDGAIIQLFDVPLAQLDAQRRANVLMGLVEKLRGWREAKAVTDFHNKSPGEIATAFIRLYDQFLRENAPQQINNNRRTARR